MLLLHLARCINRAIEVETNLREDLTITEKAPNTQMEPSPGTENFAMVCCKLYLAAQSAFLAFLQIFFALVASQSALEWRMKSV